jgi:penicillin-binding protein 1C
VRHLSKRLRIAIITAGILIFPVLVSPLPGFRVPFSTIVEARDGSLLGARIAGDGQWRFPMSEYLPDKFEKALLTFEDRYFYYHPGINPVSLLRAFVYNIKSHEIVSGGSTITMQVARLSRGNRPRTYPEKAIEILEALKLELFRSKKFILRLYAANAPFGGNNVGLEAASWRYTGKSASDLTWAEAAALAVLPNSPSLVYPGRNQEILKARRDDLLKRLYKRKFIDSLTLVLSLEEPLPGEPKPLPSFAPHLTDYFCLKSPGERIRTTVDRTIQERAIEIVNDNQKILEGNFIFNSAALIVSVKTGEVIAYVGNSSGTNTDEHGNDVDIIRSARSTGSILKPLLYAGMQESGDLLPDMLVPDVPTRFPGFAPKNFDRSFRGAVTASEALSQSLNIPAVRLLQNYSPELFLDLLQKTGFTTFDKPADYYGLSLILGGGETSLWELTGVYASLSRVLERFNSENKYYRNDYHPPLLVAGSNSELKLTEDADHPLSASSIWLTYEALLKVNRPETESGWQFFDSATGMAWKTGTSYGYRDAWAVGTTPDYVIGVWAGNADGEGRPGLTGVSAAAPLLFRLAGLMKPGRWFREPTSEMTTVRVCSESGFRAGPDCPETREEKICLNGLKSEMCPYHRIIHLDESGRYQVTAGCYPASRIINEPWFILPPAMEYFYRQQHPEYKTLPPLSPGCKVGENNRVMEFIYPTQGIKIFIPRDHTGQQTRIVPEIVHRNPARKIFWHLDDKYLGTTKSIHQIEILTQPGDHVLTAVDEDGNKISCSFTITGKE